LFVRTFVEKKGEAWHEEEKNFITARKDTGRDDISRYIIKDTDLDLEHKSDSFKKTTQIEIILFI